MKSYKLLRRGHSHYCNLPPDFIKFCGINYGDDLIIKLNEVTKEIIIKKVELMKR